MRVAVLSTVSAVAVLAATSHGAVAQDAASIAALEAQLAALTTEVNALKAAQTRQAPQSSSAGGGAVAAQLTPDQLPRPVVQTPPSPGIDGQPFYAELPEGRQTGVMATGNDKVRLTFSGQINRALNFIDDGVESDVYHVDNENASSRFRFLGETSPMNETQAVTLFEFEWPANGSLDVNQIDENVSDAINKTFNLRLLEVGFANPTWGSIFIGQGWMASDGTSETDLSGITNPGWVGHTFAFGGMLPTASNSEFDYISKDPSSAPVRDNYESDEDYESAVASYKSDSSNFVNVFGLGQDLDGLSRLKRVRYNTPIWGGFQVSGSIAAEGLWDAALRYGGSTDWAKFAAAASYWTNAKDEDEGGYESWSTSASMMLTGAADGLSFTVAAAQQDYKSKDRSDPTMYYGKVAYLADIWDVGRTGFLVQYSNNEEFRTFDEKMDFYTIGASQNIGALGAEIYGGYTQAKFDSNTYDYNDMSFFQLGTIVRF